MLISMDVDSRARGNNCYIAWNTLKERPGGNVTVNTRNSQPLAKSESSRHARTLVLSHIRDSVDVDQLELYRVFHNMSDPFHI